MKYRPLGGSGLAVSHLCLGAMMFGGPTTAKTAARIVDTALDRGINFIDTADMYADGRSEQIVGQAIRHRRDHWVLATKGGNRAGPGVNERGLGRRWITTAVERSLKRLGTDVIDFYLHRDDPRADLADTVATLGDLIRAGKIRHWGFSNFRAWRMALAVGLARAQGVPAPVACQPYYNILNRMPEVEVLPACAHFDLGVVPYSPLARGVLTGKYAPDSEPAKGSRAGRQDERMMQTEFRPESLAIARTLVDHAQARGMTGGDFAVAWLLAHRQVSSVLAGPRTLAQWTAYLSALDFAITADDEAVVDRLVPPGHPSTPGYTDPAYPIIGRVT